MHQNYNYHHSDYSSNYRLDYRHEWKLNCTHQIDPETSTKMKERQISVKTPRQREKSSMPKSTDLTNINAFTVYDSANECKSISLKNTLESDPSIHSEISPNCSSETFSEVTRKINEKEDLIREEKVIKEYRKRKRSASDSQSKAPMALKMLKASTLLNDNIPGTSFTGSEKTAKVTEE